MSFIVKRSGEEYHLYFGSDFVKVLATTEVRETLSCIDIVTQGYLFFSPSACEV